MKKSIKVFAPATVGNSKCGFDVLGFAVHEPGDVVTLSLLEEPKIEIVVIGNDHIPTQPDKNTCGVAAGKFLDRVAPDRGVKILLDKKMPVGSGLGSSAAGAAATLYGLNILFDNPCSDEQLLEFGLAAEAAACGAGHADNIAPSLFGGFILIQSYEPLKIKKISAPQNLYCTIVHPDVEIKTAAARKLLPGEIPLKTAVKQMGYLAGFIASLYTEDFELMKNSLQDVLAEPRRSQLIPLFDKALVSIFECGGLGGGISGSGPSLFALSVGQETAAKIAATWKNLYQKIGCQVYVSKINDQGPKIMG
ncbi:MAG: homoserine kinase [Candidatus Marinimicrobia bacterium]|nr:homoserine kinase [Candidatus Neomarinimicrobiota bacterium]